MADGGNRVGGGWRFRMWFRWRPVPIRWSLFRNVLVLILLIGLALFISTGLTARRSILGLSRSLIQRTVELTELELTQFFDPIEGLLQVAGAWVESGDLDLADPVSLRKRVTPLLEQVRQISAFNTGDAAGNGFTLLHTGSNWFSREVRWSDWGSRAQWQRWGGPGQPLEEGSEQTDYDPRQRPWYVRAVQDVGMRKSGEGPGAQTPMPCWTDPYVFFTSRELGMTVSLAVRAPGKDVATVVAFDVLLRDISSFTSQLRPSENGFALVISDDDMLVGLPHGAAARAGLAEPGSLVSTLGKSGPAAAVTGLQTWTTLGKPPTEPFRFESDGAAWWGGFHLVNLGQSRRFWVGVMVPQSDFLVDISRQRTHLLVVMAGALVVAVVMVSLLARRYSRPLRALVAQSERIQDLNLERQELVPCRLAEVESLTQAQEQMRRALESFARYVPVGVVRELLRRGTAAQLGGHTAVLTVMFSDMEGFTELAEKLPPEVLTPYLADYFETVERVLDKHQATIDKFIGDSILAFWGAPIPNSDHARMAALAVWEAQVALETFSGPATTLDRPKPRTRFGLATGSVVVGNIGAPDRLNYSVVGNTVNLASRLEGLNKYYGTTVLASRSLVQAAGHDLVWRHLDRVIVKGQSQAVDIYEPLGQTGRVAAQTLEKKAAYESALELLQSRKFHDALQVLRGPGRLFQQDLSFQRLTERCEQFLHEPPPQDWDTSFRFRDK